MAVFLLTEKEWESDDMLVGLHGIFHTYPESRQNTELNALYIGSDYTDYFQVDLSDGEYLKKEDFLYKGDYIPVLMGSKYKKYFELGEEFNGFLDIMGKFKNEERIFKVVGFIAENQYYTTVNAGDVLSYDNIILIPYPEMDLETYKNEFSEFKFLYTSKFCYAYYIIDPDKYAQVREKLDDLLEETGLSENFCTYKKRIEKELASNYADQLSISIFACALTLVFSLFSIVFTMLYKIDGNIKNYAIRMVVGETAGGITVRFLFEAFVLFIFGLPTSYCLFSVYYINYLCKHQLSNISMQSFPIILYLKGHITMIDMIYNLRVGDIHSAEFSDKFNTLCIPFENSLNEEQIDAFHKILDCVSDTAAAEMRAAYKVGFKDGIALLTEVQDR